jgi:uncharacterized protein involved in outer membrane biogenesis
LRKFIVGVLILLVLLIGALLVGPGFLDWNQYKPEITAQVEKATGRKLVIAGDIDLTLLPAPAFSVEGLRLANVSGAAAAQMVTLKALDVRIALMPLLEGSVKIESIELVDPVVELEILADGRANWVFGAEPMAGGGTADSQADDGTGGPPVAIQFDSLIVRNGTIVYRDSRAGQVERIEKLNAEIAAGSLQGPFRVQGDLVARGLPLVVDASLAKLVESGDVRASLGLTLAKTGDRLGFTGAIRMPIDTAQLNGKLKAEGRNLAALVSAVGDGTQLPRVLAQGFSLESTVQGSATGVQLNDLALRIGETRATGGISAAFGEKVRVDAAFALGRVDLDKWLAPGAGDAKDAGPAKAPPTSAPTAAKPTSSGFALPTGIEATLDLTADVIVYSGGVVRQTQVSTKLSNGKLLLNKAATQLPGGTSVGVAGELVAADGAPRFTGKLDLAADNLRGLLQWLSTDFPTMPADRLRKFSLTGALSATPEQLQLTDVKLRLDNSRVTGGIVFALRQRPAFGVRLAVDQFNLDAYLPPSAAPAKPAERNAPTRLTPEQTTPPPKPAAKLKAPLAFLNEFDANLVAEVGRLIYRQTPAYDLYVDANLQAGKLTLRDVRIGNLVGTGGKITGSIANLAATPTGKVGFQLAAKDLPRLLLLAGMGANPALSVLGTVKLDGSITGREKDTQINARLSAKDADIRVAGLMTGLPLDPNYEISIDASHASFTGLMRLFDPEFKAVGQKPGPVRLRGTAKGDLTNSALDLTVALAGGEMRVAGKLAGLTTAPTYALAFEGRHPEAADLMRTVIPDYRPAASKLGAFTLSAKLEGDAAMAAISDLRGKFGPVAVDGDATGRWDGPRPKLVARLTSNAINLDGFLPAGAAATSPAPAGTSRRGGSNVPRQRWSREPLQLDALRSMDAEVALSAPSITYTKYRIDKPQLDLALANGTLSLKRLSGTMFDGPFNMTGQLVADNRPRVVAAITVSKANIRKALFTAGNIDVADGVLDMTLNLATQGRSQYDLVSALGGNAKVAVRQGVVEGFDLRAVSDQLKNLDNAVSILALFQKGMSGGRTRFSSLDGTFQIAKGVATTNDLRLIADAGEGRAAGNINLPRWQITMRSEFRLTEHPKAPPFGMRLEGSLDQPRRFFEIERLQAFLLQRGIGGVLRKVLPDKFQPAPTESTTTQQQPTQQQPTQPTAPRPEDAIRGILDIFKRR